MKASRSRVVGTTVATALALVLAGCSADSGSDGGSRGGSDGGSDGGESAELTFWGWAPGYADAVKAFNKTHPGIKVTYQEVQPGAKGGYQKMLNAVQAGNAPCLAQVGFETLPSFAAQGALQDVSKVARQDTADFLPAALHAVSLGDALYGAPVDTAPMALFYNKKLYDSLGLKPPATWAEYKEQAKKIHASGPGRYISSPYLNYDYAGPPGRSARAGSASRATPGRSASPRRPTRRSPPTGRAWSTTGSSAPHPCTTRRGTRVSATARSPRSSGPSGRPV